MSATVTQGYILWIEEFRLTAGDLRLDCEPRVFLAQICFSLHYRKDRFDESLSLRYRIAAGLE
jgi:hypothetical protein